MMQISGTCNDCGQCCGCETAPNRIGPLPRNYPDAVRNWDMDFLFNEKLIFKITDHPVRGGATYGGFSISTGTYYWRWVPGYGLCANLPPYDDADTWEPQCPVLQEVQPDGTYPCGIEDIEINMPGGKIAGNDIRASMGCRWLPDTMTDESWNQWITDHPNCSFVATPVE